MEFLPPLARTRAEVRDAVRTARGRGLTVGLVPTMGALHEGHAALIRAARARTGFVVVSIFVNPTQFGPQEDLECYPRQLEADRAVCGRAGADLIFAPTADTMYPPGFQTFVEVEALEKPLCGAFRPGHFRGVATVVLKLLNIVGPDLAVFGQKDAQQARLLRRMVGDLDVPVEIRVEPTVRAADGLALSSRNQYLTPSQREEALALWRALERARGLVAAGERRADVVRQSMQNLIESASSIRLDYVALVDPQTLEEVRTIEGPVLAAVAGRLGAVRLIDNLELDWPPVPAGGESG